MSWGKYCCINESVTEIQPSERLWYRLYFRKLQIPWTYFYTNKLKYVWMYIWLYAIHSHKYASMLVAWVNLANMHTYVHILIFILTYVCMYIQTYVYTYIYIGFCTLYVQDSKRCENSSHHCVYNLKKFFLS